MGGVRACVALRARQPDRDHRREPARSARRDDDRVEHRRLRRTSTRLRLERDRGRRSRGRGDRPRLQAGRGDEGTADRDRRPHDQGQGRQGRRGQGRLARQAAGRPGCGDRGARRHPEHPRRRRQAGPGGTAHVPEQPTGATPLRARPGSRDAKGVRRSARGTGDRPRRRRRARRRGQQLDVRRDLQASASGSVLRDVHRRAAADRGGGRSARARLECVRVDVRRFLLARVRLRPHGGDQPRQPAARGLARRCFDRRGRPVADGSRGHRLTPGDSLERRAPSVRRKPDREARRRDGGHGRHRLPAHAAPEHAGHLRPGRRVRSRRQQGDQIVRRRQRHDRRRSESRCTRHSKPLPRSTRRESARA